MLLVDIKDGVVASDCMEVINSKGNIGHKRIKISSAESDNKEILSF